MVGSSSTYRAPTRPLPSCEARRIRWASPPLKVLALRSSVRYSMPTLSMNCRRDVISLITAFEISCSFFVSLSPLKNSIASSMDLDERLTMFVPVAEPSCPAGACTLPRNTLSDSGRRRTPLHTSHGSSPKKYLLPRPLHSGHAPYGELNEKRRGSISGNEKPSYAHINFADAICATP